MAAAFGEGEFTGATFVGVWCVGSALGVALLVVAVLAGVFEGPPDGAGGIEGTCRAGVASMVEPAVSISLGDKGKAAKLANETRAFVA